MSCWQTQPVWKSRNVANPRVGGRLLLCVTCNIYPKKLLKRPWTANTIKLCTIGEVMFSVRCLERRYILHWSNMHMFSESGSEMDLFFGKSELFYPFSFIWSSVMHQCGGVLWETFADAAIEPLTGSIHLEYECQSKKHLSPKPDVTFPEVCLQSPVPPLYYLFTLCSSHLSYLQSHKPWYHLTSRTSGPAFLSIANETSSSLFYT